MDEIAMKIKQIRKERGLTLKKLSEETGLSISFLSQVENGSTSLAITSLKKIGEVFEIPIASFFECQSNDENYISEKKARKTFQLEGSNSKYTRLSGEFSGRVLESLLVTLSPNQQASAVFSHPGEEFYYILEGTVVFHVNDVKYFVREGDSIHFPSEFPHFWENPLDKESKILCVLTPVIF